jgi:tetratricopeptide (TPR) repeat protein
LLATLTAVMNLARLQVLQGRLRAAAATYGELLQIAGGPDVLRGVFGSMPYYVGLGDIHRERNKLDAAGEYLDQAVSLAQSMVTLDAEYATQGYLALARLQHTRGEQAQAQATLEAASDLAHRRGFVPHLVTRIAAVRAQLALAPAACPPPSPGPRPIGSSPTTRWLTRASWSTWSWPELGLPKPARAPRATTYRAHCGCWTGSWRTQCRRGASRAFWKY